VGTYALEEPSPFAIWIHDIAFRQNELVRMVVNKTPPFARVLRTAMARPDIASGVIAGYHERGAIILGDTSIAAVTHHTRLTRVIEKPWPARQPRRSNATLSRCRHG